MLVTCVFIAALPGIPIFYENSQTACSEKEQRHDKKNEILWLISVSYFRAAQLDSQVYTSTDHDGIAARANARARFSNT